MAINKSTLQTSAGRNRINTAMRSSPEWRSAIKAMGHNPDGPLRLSKSEQRQLGTMLDLPMDDFHIDPAGNINDYHGWKGLPTWAKVAIVGGTAAGAAYLAPFGIAGASGLSGGSLTAAEAAAMPGGMAATAGGGTGIASAIGGGGGMLGGLGGLLSGAGTTGKIANMVGKAAPLLSGMAKSRAESLNSQNDQTLSQDQLRQRMWEAQTQALLQRGQMLQDQAKFNIQAPSMRADQAKRGSLMANVQDLRFPDNPRVKVMHPTGGIRPSALGPEARQAGSQLAQLGLSNIGKDSFEVPNLPKAPGLSELSGGGFLDSLLGGATAASGILNLLQNQQKQQRPPDVTGQPIDMSKLIGQMPLDTSVPEPPAPYGQNPALFRNLRF